MGHGATQAYTEDLAGGFTSLRSDWRNFLVNCGTVADRFLAYTYANVTYFMIFPPFFSDFENNGKVKISEFLCVGLAIENIFGPKTFWGLVVPYWGSVICGGRLPPKGTSTTSPLIVHAFCVQIWCSV